MFVEKMVDDFKLKMAVISGASNALKIREQNPRWTDEKILQKINKDVKDIISNLED
jgi:hypothetical protein